MLWLTVIQFEAREPLCCLCWRRSRLCHSGGQLSRHSAPPLSQPSLKTQDWRFRNFLVISIRVAPNTWLSLFGRMRIIGPKLWVDWVPGQPSVYHMLTVCLPLCLPCVYHTFPIICSPSVSHLFNSCSLSGPHLFPIFSTAIRVPAQTLLEEEEARGGSVLSSVPCVCRVTMCSPYIRHLLIIYLPSFQQLLHICSPSVPHIFSSHQSSCTMMCNIFTIEE